MHIFFDFDSTLVSKESLDEVITHALKYHPERTRLIREIEAITNAGMEGTLPFTESLRKRFAVLAPTREQFTHVGEMLRSHVTDGMHEAFSTLRGQGMELYIVSGGFYESVLPVAKDLGVPETHIRTNQCIYGDDDTCTIDTNSPNYSDDGKTPVITFLKARDGIVGPTCMVGDGANDLSAYTSGVVDHFICFTGHKQRKAVMEVSPHTAQSSSSLVDCIFRLSAV